MLKGAFRGFTLRWLQAITDTLWTPGQICAIVPQPIIESVMILIFDIHIMAYPGTVVIHSYIPLLSHSLVPSCLLL